MFTCVLNKNSNIGTDDVQWYGLIMDTGVTEMVNQDRDNITLLTHTGNTMNSSLTITNVRKSHTGYYWVRTPSLIVCNASLTVLTGEYVDGVHQCICILVQIPNWNIHKYVHLKNCKFQKRNRDQKTYTTHHTLIMKRT